jgi:hypothetical protein
MSVSPGSRTAHVKEQFYVVCRKLNLDEGNTARGLKVLELILGMGIHPLPDAFRGGKGPLATSGSASKQQNSIVGGRDYFCSPRDYEANMWTACALFIANTQEGHATGTAVSVAEWNGVKFSTLMIATKLRIMAFFDNMGVIQNHSKRGTLNMCRDFDEKLNRLKTVVITDSAMHRKFVQLWKYRDALGADNIVSRRGKKSVETHLLQYSWTLFLLLKTHLYGETPNLLEAFHLLIACVVLTIEGHSAHQTKALCDRRERQSGTSPVPHLPLEVPEQMREAEAIAALVGASVAGGIKSKSIAKMIPRRKRGDIMKMFVNHVGTVELDEVMLAVRHVEKYVSELITAGCLKSSDSPPRLLGSVVSAKFQGALGKHMAVNSYYYSTAYDQENLLSAWNLDERVFLRDDAIAQIGTPIKLVSKQQSYLPVSSGKKLFQDPGGAGNEKQVPAVAPVTGIMVHQVRSVLSPSRSPGAMGAVVATPVTEAYQYNSWLRRTVKPSPCEPLQVAKRCFAACKESPLSFVNDLLKQMQEQLLYESNNGGGSVVSALDLDAEDEATSTAGDGAERADPIPHIPQVLRRSSDGNVNPLRRAFTAVNGQGGGGGGAPQGTKRALLRLRNALDCSVRLYWRGLDALLGREMKRLEQNSVELETLLRKAEFHKCMFALCVDVILVANNNNSMVFPAVPERLKIHPSSLVKMVEIFVRGEPSLPGQLRRHLRWCEEQILEKHAWNSTSPMLKKLGTLAVPLGQIEATAQTAPSGRRSGIPFTVDKFLEKVEQVAASRLRNLSELLNLGGAIVDQAWTVTRHALLCKYEILQGRHLHQVILCSVYGICKVNEVDMTFAHIINAYKKLPELFSPANLSAKTQQTARLNVIMDIDLRHGNQGANSRGDIIKFYNDIFIPCMKEFLMKFKVPALASATVQAVPKERTSSLPASHRVASNVFVIAPRGLNEKGNAINTKGASADPPYPAWVEQTPRTAALYAHREAATISRINQRLNGDPLMLAPVASIPHQQNHDTGNEPHPEAPDSKRRRFAM